MLVLGSSLSVPTACDLPEECLEPREGKQETCPWCLTPPQEINLAGAGEVLVLLFIEDENEFTHIQIISNLVQVLQYSVKENINHRQKFRSQLLTDRCSNSGEKSQRRETQ